MPRERLITLLAVNGLAGSLAAVVTVGGLLGLDIGGIGTLVAGAENPLLPAALMTAGFVVTLASVAMGVAVMRLGADDQGPDGGRLVPVPVRVERRPPPRR